MSILGRPRKVTAPVPEAKITWHCRCGHTNFAHWKDCAKCGNWIGVADAGFHARVMARINYPKMRDDGSRDPVPDMPVWFKPRIDEHRLFDTPCTVSPGDTEKLADILKGRTFEYPFMTVQEARKAFDYGVFDPASIPLPPAVEKVPVMVSVCVDSVGDGAAFRKQVSRVIEQLGHQKYFMRNLVK